MHLAPLTLGLRPPTQLPRDAVDAQGHRAGQPVPAPISDLAVRELFAERYRERIHIVVAMSPIGDAFRTRLRANPALCNNSTIVWYRAWPADALVAVASAHLKDELCDRDGGESASQRQRAADPEEAQRQLQAQARSVFEVCAHIHLAAKELCERYGRDTGRSVHVMPSSYLTLVETYRKLLREQRKEISRNRKRYRTGLRQLEAADAKISDLRQDLIEQRKLIDEQKNSQLLRTHNTLKEEVQSIWQRKYEKCEGQIVVGQKLLNDLSSEKTRWEVRAQEATRSEPSSSSSPPPHVPQVSLTPLAGGRNRSKRSALATKACRATCSSRPRSSPTSVLSPRTRAGRLSSGAASSACREGFQW